MNIHLRERGDQPVELVVSSPPTVIQAPRQSEALATGEGESAAASGTERKGTEQKPAYPAPSPQPTQSAPHDVRFDFNDGARIICPPSEHSWKVTLRDLDTGNILFETQFAGGHVNSSKRYFIRFGIEISRNGEPVLSHEYSAKDRDVLIQFPVGTLGDPMGWFPYAVKFKEKHGCRLSCALSPPLI